MSKPEAADQAPLELFIGACRRTVAATTPEVRFDGRISERSAERSERRPLTLMNSAPRSSGGTSRRARKENAGAWPAFWKRGRLGFRAALKVPDF
jgi:hypothetical protein